jgi:hypothetical protein
MKVNLLRLVSTSFFLGLAVAANSLAMAETIKVQAGKLEEHGSFQPRDEGGIEILTVGGGVGHSPALGAIALPHAGEWHLWVTSRSMPGDGKNDRRFSVRVGTQISEKTFGSHLRSVNREFFWEDGGTFDLPSGPLLVVIGERNTPNAQCGEIMLTDEIAQTVPEELSAHATQAKTVPLTRAAADPVTELPPVSVASTKRIATLQNDLVRISFLRGSMQAGAAGAHDDHDAVIQKIEVRSGKNWRSLETTGGADSYRVVYRPADSNPALVNTFTQYPSWDTSFAPEVTFSAGGAEVKGHQGPSTAPWLAGQLSQLRPISATQVNPDTVDLHFAALPIGELTARWHLIKDQPSASVQLSFRLNSPGYLTLGYHGAVEDTVANLDFLMEPYLYLGHRFPAESVSEPSNQTPTPAALVTRRNISYAVMAEPESLPFAWANPTQARYTIGLRNESGKAEPFLYAPVLGSPQSLHVQPGDVTAQFRVWMQEGHWTEAYRGIVTKAFGLKDYRRPVAASLSDTILNLNELLHNDEATGWDARAKGSWNIEQRSTVTQPSPLTYLGYALLSGDEQFYRKYALPSLEFLISRPSSHFSAEINGVGELGKPDVPLGGPNAAYTAAVYASAYEMTQGATPAFAAFCFDADGKLRSRPTHYASFDDELEVYKATGDKRWLTQAMASADKYIADNLIHLPSRDLGAQPFVNVSFTPDWEGLLHLYEATHEARFLKASQEGAYWLMSSVWVQPAIPRNDTITFPSGKIDDPPALIWKGDRRFRLGFFDGPGDLSKPAPSLPHLPIASVPVPSWEVSNVGLGLEQPVTYAQSKNDQNIFMSVWATNLMRLYGLTGDTLFRTYARNATIGRFSNYPGYYLRLYTDVYQAPDYVYKGPDVTDFYYHHIAAFASYIQDYVFSDAEVRSEGQFAFPYARQFGYVWFDTRLRGFAPGKVYGETAWPWINRTAATGDNKNVDVVLAHNSGTLYVALMNQVNTDQHVDLHFDPKVLGAELTGKKARVWAENQKILPVPLKEGSLGFDLPPGGFTVLAIDDLHINVPAHHVAPPGSRAQQKSGQEDQKVVGSQLTATATYINVPEFSSRELYIYVRSTAKQCSGATLVYTTQGGNEKKITVNQFPCEFSVPLPYDESPVSWRVEDLHPAQ